MKTLAFVIRGQVREWENAKHSIFNFAKLFEAHYDVHYFFITWDQSYSTISNFKDRKSFQFDHANNSNPQKIKDSFGEKNVTIKIFNSEEIKAKLPKTGLVEEYDQIAYLRLLANLEKQNYEIENDMVFDLVVELRPDLFIVPYSTITQDLGNLVFEDFSYSAFSPIFQRAYSKDKNKGIVSFSSLWISDLIFISNSFTSDLINSEYYFLKELPEEVQEVSFPHDLISTHLLQKALVNTEILKYIIQEIEIVRAQKFFILIPDFKDISLGTFKQITKANEVFQKTKEMEPK